MTSLKEIARGHGGLPISTVGKIYKWNKNLLKNNTYKGALNDKIIYVERDLTLYEAAIIENCEPLGVIISHGNQNYHPLIFFKDSLIPCIVGTGKIFFYTEYIKLECKNGIVYSVADPDNLSEEHTSLKNNSNIIYSNVGSKKAILKAFELGTRGIGIFRTEFTAVRFLISISDYEIFPGETIESYCLRTNEADTIYELIKNTTLRQLLKLAFRDVVQLSIKLFPAAPIIIRSIDLERNHLDSLGYRGIRRCLAEDGGVLIVIAEALKEIIEETLAKNIALIFPLVSNYEQIFTATRILINIGFNIIDPSESNYIKVGWKIEQPSSALCNSIWINSFKADFGVFPNYLGIGTNDLTQFTLAVGRFIDTGDQSIEVQKYIDHTYNDIDFSVIKLLIQIAKDVKNLPIEVILHGELASNNVIANLLQILNIRSSVTVLNLPKVSEAVELATTNPISLNQLVSQLIDQNSLVINYNSFIIKELHILLAEFYN